MVKFAVDDTIGAAPFKVTFTNLSTSEFSPILYSWDFGDQETSTDENPVHTFKDTGSFAVVLTGTDQIGCTDTCRLMITVLGDDCYDIPNIFTPNGDNLNDYFNANGICVLDVEGTIFDRWGLELSKWNGKDKGWDGTTKGGKIVPDGTYFYFLDVIIDNGTRVQRKGTITLIK